MNNNTGNNKYADDTKLENRPQLGSYLKRNKSSVAGASPNHLKQEINLPKALPTK